MTQQRLRPEPLLALKSYQYGSVGPTEIADGDLNGIVSSRRGGRRFSSRFATTIGLVAVIGMVLWVGRLDLTFDESNDDEDRFDWENVVPLLGQSMSHYKAQQEANHNRDYLYLDPKREKKRRRNNKKNREAIPVQSLLASSGSDDVDLDVEAHDGCEATVMILRHCEKGQIREHCDYLGYERSVYLASLFGKDARWPAPSYIFAEEPGHRRNPNKRNYREVETVLPLAEKFNLTVDTSFSTLDNYELAQTIQGMMRSGEMCGKLTVISWKHSKMPKLAYALGCGPEDGCPCQYDVNRFDDIWQIKYVYREPLHSSRRHLQAPDHKEWMIFGYVQQEDFDPLAFSKKMGDYPEGGTKTGARWRAYDHEIPERTVFD